MTATVIASGGTQRAVSSGAAGFCSTARSAANAPASAGNACLGPAGCSGADVLGNAGVVFSGTAGVDVSGTAGINVSGNAGAAACAGVGEVGEGRSSPPSA